MKSVFQSVSFTLLSLCVLTSLVVDKALAEVMSRSVKSAVSSNQTTQSVLVLRAGRPDEEGRLKFGPESSPSEDEINRFRSGKANMAELALRFKPLRDRLLAMGVPFEPNLLLRPEWKREIAGYSTFLGLQNTLTLSSGKIEGAVVANKVVLPSVVELTGDTVILANEIVTNGETLHITGPYAVFGFSMNGTKTGKSLDGSLLIENSITGIRPDLMTNVRKRSGIVINTSGHGRDEWYEKQRRFKAGLTNVNPIDESGQHGARGTDGSYGNRGSDGSDSPSPIDGNCVASNPNGLDTPTATAGQRGDDGGDALDDATPGQSGGPIVWTVSASDTGTFTFISRGGNGGDGGTGGRGGDGGDGGDGKRGGNGATCGCSVGNGGRGGDAGDGGAGGRGGWGGDGKQGGNGGNVTVNVEHGSTADLIFHLQGGFGGAPGQAGQGGRAGEPGEIGIGGLPGPTSCGIYGSAGNSGNPKNKPDNGTSGSPGDAGSQGNNGTDQVVPFSGGGTPPNPCISAKSYESSCGCTPYYWVLYVSYDGGQTWQMNQYWYAGCW